MEARDIIQFSTNYAYGGTGNQENLNKQPDTNTTYWALYAAGAGSSPAWSSGTKYFSSGAYTTTNDNASHTITGCYSESGQFPSRYSSRSIVLGGDQAAGVGNAANIKSNLNNLYLSNTLFNPGTVLAFHDTNQ